MNSKRKCAWKKCRASNPASSMLIKGMLAYCNSDHEYQHALDALGRLRKRKAKEEKQKHKQRKEKFYSEDLPRQKRLTQAACNKLVSLLDKGRDCISCGRALRGGRFQHASHFKSVGANSALRFDPRNIHLSCVNCNQYKSGNLVGYRDGIWARYGLAILDYLDSAPRLKEWAPEELITLRKEYRAEIRRLEQGLGPSRNWRELPVANPLQP